METVKMVAKQAYDQQPDSNGPKKKLNLFVGGHSWAIDPALVVESLVPFFHLILDRAL